MKGLGLGMWAIVCLPAVISAQGMRPVARYERANEVAVRGTVVEVRNVVRPASLPGVYLGLRTEINVLQVHLGPQILAAKPGARLSPGEAVEVRGVFARYRDSDILLAREVRKADATLTFRNARGLPVVGRQRTP
jgi:hypothetical protein